MKLSYIIFGWYFVRCVFIAFPDTSITTPFFDVTMPVSSYVWNNLENAFILFICYQWYLASKGKGQQEAYRDIMAQFVTLCVDSLDFILTGNAGYFDVTIPFVGDYPVTNNVFMVAAYGGWIFKSRKPDIAHNE